MLKPVENVRDRQLDAVLFPSDISECERKTRPEPSIYITMRLFYRNRLQNVTYLLYPNEWVRRLSLTMSFSLSI